MDKLFSIIVVIVVLSRIVAAVSKGVKKLEDLGGMDDKGLEARLEEAVRQAKAATERKMPSGPPPVQPLSTNIRQNVSPIAPPPRSVTVKVTRRAQTSQPEPPRIPVTAKIEQPAPVSLPVARALSRIAESVQTQQPPSAKAASVATPQAMASVPRGMSRAELRRLMIWGEILNPPRLRGEFRMRGRFLRG